MARRNQSDSAEPDDKPIDSAPTNHDGTIDPRGIMETWAKQRKEGQEPSCPDDDNFRVQYPTLWVFMTDTTIGGKYIRTPPTISMSLDGSNIRLTFRDNGLEKSCTSSATTLLGAFAALDANMRHVESWSSFRSRNKGLKEIGSKPK